MSPLSFYRVALGFAGGCVAWCVLNIFITLPIPLAIFVAFGLLYLARDAYARGDHLDALERRHRLEQKVLELEHQLRLSRYIDSTTLVDEVVLTAQQERHNRPRN